MTTEKNQEPSGRVGELLHSYDAVVTLVLGAFSIVALIGIIVLYAIERDSPDALIATLGMAVGALGQRLNQQNDDQS